MTVQANMGHCAAASVRCNATASRRALPRTVWRFALCLICTTTLLSAPACHAQVWLAPAGESMLGAKEAVGAVIWSHGRSIDSEDSTTPAPPYLAALRTGGWDIFRFNRLRAVDALVTSAKSLVEWVHVLKQAGYRRITLAGQSFGGFLSLMAADTSDEVDAVIATAPAAFGDSAHFPDIWHANATKLYPLLQQVLRARIMLFYFQGDDFDPGGRGAHSHDILEQRQLDYVIVDRPPNLTGHVAADTPLFAKFYGACILAFLNANPIDLGIQCGGNPRSRTSLAWRRAHAPS